MTRKLNSADRQAVDLIFDKLASGKGNDGDGFVAMSGGVSEQRLESVEQILKVLDEMPAADPPADLTVRTLQFIAARTGVAMPAPSATDQAQPMA